MYRYNMISLELHLILFCLIILADLFLIKMITKNKLELKYALLWLLLGIILLLMVFIPNLVMFLAQILGIDTPTNALFLFGILILLAITFSLTVALSRATNKIKDLAQELGIIKYEFEKLKYIEKENNNESN